MRPRHLLLMLLLVLIWGFNWVMIRVGLNGLPPLALTCIRLFLVSVPAIFFIKRPSSSWGMLLTYGFLMFFLQFSLLFLGIYFGVSAGLGALVTQMQVFFTILLAVIFLKEHVSKWQIIGALVSFAGIIFVGLHIGGKASMLGLISLLLSALAWSGGNLMTKKLKDKSMLSLIVWGSFVSWPPLLLCSLFFEGSDKVLYSLGHLTWQSIAAILYLIIASTWFGTVTWCWLMSKYRAAVVAPFSMLIPVVALLSTSLVLDEPLDSWKILAVLLVITGLSINFFSDLFITTKSKRRALKIEAQVI